MKQAGAELGQAQLKLGLDFTPFLFSVDLVFSRFCLIVLIEFKVLMNRFGSVYLVLYIPNILLGRIDFVD